MRKPATLLALVLVMSLAPVAHAEVPSNDNLADAIAVATPFSHTVDTTEATTEVGEPLISCDPRPTLNTVWYSYTASSTTRLFLDTVGSDFDTILAIYIDDPRYGLGLTGFDGMYPYACEDPSIEDEFEVYLEGGYTYYFQLGGHADSPSGTAVLNVSVGGTISGTVTDEQGGQLSGICVEASSFDEEWDWWRYWAFDETGPDGTYSLTGLPAGSYRVSFWDCGGDYEYLSEVYNNKDYWDEADLVEVALDGVVTGIDAALAAYVPPPPPPPVYTDLAVSGLTVENLPVQTDFGDVGYTGYQRRITTELSNLSDTGSWSALRIRACQGRYDCTTIFRDYLLVEAGSQVTSSFRWNAMGWLGDVTIQADVCPMGGNVFDTNWTNNSRSKDHYVIAGGTGLDFTIEEPDDYFESPMCSSGPIVIRKGATSSQPQP